MKKLLSAIAVAGVALSAGSAWAADKTIKLSVPGMYCASCPYIVKSAISEVKGVKTVETRLEDRSATITFDDAVTNTKAIIQATANVGYPSKPFDQSS